MLVLRNHVFSVGPIYSFGVFLPFIKAAVRYVPPVVVEQGELEAKKDKTLPDGVQAGDLQAN